MNARTVAVCSAIKAVLLVSGIFSPALLSQSLPPEMRPDPFGKVNTPGGAPTYSTQGSVILITVRSENGAELDRQALVKLYNKNDQSTILRTTQDHAIATFEDVGFGNYEIEVSAFGYLTAHQELSANRELHSYHLDILVKPDPAALELKVSDTTAIPAKARNALNGGIAALKSGNFKNAQKKLGTAHSLVPLDPEVNLLLGYISFQERKFEDAQSYLQRTISFEPRNFQALILLGRIAILNEDFPRGRDFLEQATTANTENWLPHYFLAETYLKLNQFDKARDEAQFAIAKGKGNAGVAQVVVGEALANLGHDTEAVQTLENYLNSSPQAPNAPQVRDLIAAIKLRGSDQPENLSQPSVRLPSLDIKDTRIGELELQSSLRSWQPPGVDAVRPAVAANVPCPYDAVVDGVGKRAKQLADDIVRFGALEEMLHQQLSEVGTPITSVTRKFEYIATISTSPGAVAIDEDRRETSGAYPFPDHISTRGLPTLAFIFHPDMRGDFEITCEGLGEWNRRATWLLHFRQRADRPNRFQEFKVAGLSYPANLKGRAWIAADSFQILRIESELVNPIPQVGIINEHQMVEYGPVPFQKKNIELWLPKHAEIYLDLKKRHYFRQHNFDNFKLFSVDSEEKVGDIKPSQSPVPAPGDQLR